MAAKSIFGGLLAQLVIFVAPVSDSHAAAEPPQCVNISPNTTQCVTNGSTQIVTTPARRTFNYGFPWFGWSGLVIGVR